MRSRSSLSFVCCSTAKKNELTDNQVLEHFNDILLASFVSTEEVVGSSSSKHFAAPLIHSSQLLVRKIFLEGVLLAELIAPEGSTVGVNCIVCASTDQAEGNDILISVQIVGNGLVELSMSVGLVRANAGGSTSMGSVLNAVFIELEPRCMMALYAKID